MTNTTNTIDTLVAAVARLSVKDRLTLLDKLSAAISTDPAKARVARVQAEAARNPAALRYALGGFKRAGTTLDAILAGGVQVLDDAMAKKNLDLDSKFAIKNAAMRAGIIG